MKKEKIEKMIEGWEKLLSDELQFRLNYITKSAFLDRDMIN